MVRAKVQRLTETGARHLLLEAAGAGHAALVELLLRNGVPLTAVDARGNTLLIEAAESDARGRGYFKG